MSPVRAVAYHDILLHICHCCRKNVCRVRLELYTKGLVLARGLSGCKWPKPFKLARLTVMHITTCRSNISNTSRYNAAYDNIANYDLGANM